MKGILFQPEMIKAIIEGRKTQTRRVINPQPSLRFQDKTPDFIRGLIVILGKSYDDCYEVHPRYDFGDIVYIKEKYWQDQSGGVWGYMDTIEWPPSNCGGKAISPLFMPAWAARYYIEIDDIWAERLQDISEEDVIFEGTRAWFDNHPQKINRDTPPIIDQHYFAVMWNEINKPPHDWESNPWVWKYVFHMVVKPLTRREREHGEWQRYLNSDNH